MSKEEHIRKYRIAEVEANIWNWQRIADISRRVCDVSFDFFKIPIPWVEKELLMTAFTGGIVANHEAEVEIIGGPIIKVEDGVRLLAEDDSEKLVDETGRSVVKLNNTPFLTLTLPPQSRSLLRLIHNYADSDIKSFWFRFVKEASVIGGLSFEDEGSKFNEDDPVICFFDFDERFLQGRGNILVPVYKQSDLVKRRLKRHPDFSINT